MKCEGCGIKIQSIDGNKSGYLPQNVLDEKIINNEKILCQRCFKLKNYNQLMPLDINSDFYPQLDKVLKDFKTVIWVIDIIDFDGTFRKDLAEKLKNKNVILIVNKIDLLPKSSALSEIKEWLFKKVRKYLNIKKDNIRMVSSKKGFGLQRVRKLITMTEKEKVLIMGVTNVGKSSLLNKLINKDITVSSYPGTTLNVIKTKLDQSNIEIYDTPGIEPNDRFCDILDIHSQVKMIPNKEITIQTLKADPDKYVFLSGLAYFKILEHGDYDLRPIFSIFMSQNIGIHITKEEKVEDILKNRKVAFPPYNEEFDYKKLKFNEYELNIKEGYDLSLPGLGWVSVKRGPLNIKLFIPEKMSYIIRKSMIKPKI